MYEATIPYYIGELHPIAAKEVGLVFIYVIESRSFSFFLNEGQESNDRSTKATKTEADPRREVEQAPL